MTGEIIKGYKQQCKTYKETLYKSPKNTKESIESTKSLLSDHIRKLSRKIALPIPKGDTAYAMAKNAEYKERDLDKAEFFYKQAINNGERVESAIKDLASLLHQKGKTKEACEILKQNRFLFQNDLESFENLYKTLEKQILATGNSQNKSLKLSGLTSDDSEDFVKGLFLNPVRIQSLAFAKEEIDGKIVYYCILRFNSHSSARKTLEGFHHWDKYKVEWISIHGELVGDAHYARQKMEEYRKYHPTFDYSLFERDPQGYIYCLPLDSISLDLKRQISESEDTLEGLLGKNLFSTIFSEKPAECYIN